ncbi:MAG: preprotein translocase subunit SecE [Erysipelotrichaceae bacterium]
MKWFTLKGLKSEAKEIEWPKRKQLMKDTGTVLMFTVLFGIFFVLCDVAASTFLKLVGIGI